MRLSMRKNIKNSGFTLIEILVAAGVFAGLAAFTTWGVIYGLRAQQFDNSVREAQTITREVLNKMTDEMRMASVLPVTGLGESLIPSGVIYPDSYGDTASLNASHRFSASDGTFYALGTQLLDDPTYANRQAFVATNRLIFTRPSETSTNLFNAANLNNYVYVEWLVPEKAPNTIWRRVHSLTSLNGTYCGNDYVDSQWLVNASYFTGATGIKTGSTERDWTVAKLPGANDYFNFKVEHAEYVDPGTNVVAREIKYGTRYDRNLFYITMEAVVFADVLKEGGSTGRRYERTTSEREKAKHSNISIRSQVRLQTGE